MTYIFIFLGEFGFELFNWQGVIRKFSRTISPSDKIICCSRGNLYPIYEMAEAYIDIAEVDIFKQSRATWYWASPNRTVSMNFIRTWIFDRRLRAEVTSFVLNRLRATDQLKNGESFQFVFSSGKLDLNGCSFGVTRYGFFIDALAAVYDGLKSKFPAFVDEIDKLRRGLLGRLECLDMRREHDGAYGMLDIENNIYLSSPARL
ncbi:hypothetical protein [Candidatus Thiosymbion oneisti]|uniref:hypothetical protein n=1 Tax=Candidatus Thiosymbion oneisti TaxID=589554 RepID=UPI000B7F9C36|nr:hypothetical protein [Candidatus Thiosymbion oneisti]